MATLPELYIATDIEADGPIPGPYSMISLGMQVVNRKGKEFYFYSEIKPISENFIPEALAVSQLDRDKLIKHAPDATIVMRQAKTWIDSLRAIGRPVFLAAPAVWDGMFVHWYFMNFIGTNPFGKTGSGIDLRSYWMGKHNCEWVETRKINIIEKLELNTLTHTHHAGEDAQELAQIFSSVLNT